MSLAIFKGQNRRKNSTALLKPVIALLVTLQITGCNSEAKTDKKASDAATPAPVLTVTSVNPSFKNVTQTLNVNGTIAAWDLLSVSPSVNGLKVISIFAESGDSVHKGQLLAKLDDSMLNAQLLSARARLINAEAQLAKAKQPNRSQDVTRQKEA